MAFSALFGEVLLTKGGEKATHDVLADKTAVGVYFSAQSSDECKAFTQYLVEVFQTTLKGKGMEIVYVSSDTDQASFDVYYGEMPWCALPYPKRKEQDRLSKQFRISSIPVLVILGSDGAVITSEGREALGKDPNADKYPWFPPTKAEKAKTILDALGPELVGKTGGKPIGLYFSAHWCPPCRAFTPKLAEFYKDGLEERMEIIFVSSDEDQAGFDEYYKEMPWLALPFDKRESKNVLSDICRVQGIPTLVVVGQDGAIITTKGRKRVMNDPKAETFPDGWLPQPFNDVNDDPSDVEAQPCLIALGSDEAMTAAVKAVAAEHYAAANRDVSAMELGFFFARDGDITEQTRSLTGISSGDRLLFFDIPSDGAFYVCGGEARDVAAVKRFIDDVKARRCPRRQLGAPEEQPPHSRL